MLGLLLETDLSSEQRKFARTARDSADGLLTIINDILDYSKLEARGIELEQTSFSISQVVDGVTSLLTSRADAKGLELTQALPPDLPCWLVGDPTRVRQVLFNLVGNAIKFTNQGAVRVACSHRALADDAIEVRFEVLDTGIGLSEEAKAKLFTRFTQADSSTTRKFGGTGLGLAISKQLVEMMGGEIGVESEPGSGSCFWFTIKSSLGECPVADEADTKDACAVLPTTKLRILVADDNHVNQMFVTALLTKRGHAVDVVGNGAEAVEAVKSVGYDLVLMDVQMPVMDGPTATRAIRELDGPISMIPIIALTANAMQGQREEYLACGMNAYVTKPVDPSALFASIARLVRDKPAAAEPRAGADTPAQDTPSPAQAETEVVDALEPAAAKGDGEALDEETTSLAGDNASVPIFDEERLAELRACFAQGELRTLLNSVPDEGGICLHAIKDALAANDLDAARRAAHRLKGMASNFGAMRITALARRIELEAPSIGDVRQSILQLQNALDETQEKIGLIA
jgi:CheY-like chemotaxis protein